ncbi:MAG: MarR family transcriptional regulator [Pseudonocardiales bacterium]|nr:MarR family transcriptional regulator [Jatrophihabitantaceae bacterium]MCW2603719.1 MarR family transcriptional regulator [Pseudonocardiales bacterium]
MTAPLTPDRLGERLTEVFGVLGPLYRRVARAVEQAEPIDGVSIGVRAVLDLLDLAGPQTVPQLSRAQDLSRQFVQRMVNDAVAAGFAEITSNPAHQRSSLIALTPGGAVAIRAVKAREHELLRKVGGDLTDADIDTCLRVLAQMLGAFDRIQ